MYPRAIEQACDEIIAGKLHDQFIVDPIQGGAGTSTNMNANEVIANRAIEILGGKKGDYTLVNPNDDVNCGQSTNDVYPSCGKMTLHTFALRLLPELQRWIDAMDDKAHEFDTVVKMGRTQLQDAVPHPPGAGVCRLRRRAAPRVPPHRPRPGGAAAAEPGRHGRGHGHQRRPRLRAQRGAHPG